MAVVLAAFLYHPLWLSLKMINVQGTKHHRTLNAGSIDFLIISSCFEAAFEDAACDTRNDNR